MTVDDGIKRIPSSTTLYIQQRCSNKVCQPRYATCHLSASEDINPFGGWNMHRSAIARSMDAPPDLPPNGDVGAREPELKPRPEQHQQRASTTPPTFIHIVLHHYHLESHLFYPLLFAFSFHTVFHTVYLPLTRPSYYRSPPYRRPRNAPTSFHRCPDLPNLPTTHPKPALARTTNPPSLIPRMRPSRHRAPFSHPL